MTDKPMPEKENLAEMVREEISELLGEMESSLLELEKNPADLGLVNRVFRAMHTIKGAANMFGLESVATLTHEVESAFDGVRSGKFGVSRDLLDLSLAAKDHIWLQVEVPDMANPELRRLLDGLRALIAASLATAPAEPLLGATGLGVEDSPDIVASSEQPCTESETPEPQRAETFHVIFRPTAEKALLSTDVLSILAEVQSLGACEVIVRVEDVPELEALDPESCALWWHLILTTDKGENAIRDVFIFADELGEVRVEAVEDAEALTASLREDAALAVTRVLGADASTPRSAAPPPPATPSLPKPPPPRPATVETSGQDVEPTCPAPLSVGARPSRTATPPARGEAPAQAPRKKDTQSSIRVDAYKLDDMVALVGELVIAQSKLSQVVSRYHDPMLQSVAEELELLSASLRDQTLSMRMLPIGTTFDRFRRLVRDLSHELGKEIELVTQGADTELDKTVIEQLGDPLVHLLRNAIDHGIEAPAVRMAAGKSARGSIVLAAQHSGGNVLIKITDDGKGLDREAIVAKGQERGLINDPDQLSDAEIYSLIFHPGFSTATAVTNVSGRGVGMDVVKRSIEGLRGNVEIDSVKGRGTTVTVKLPLTLAIIEGLQVRVGDEFFVIPLSAVEECMELRRTGGRGADSDGLDKRIVNLRNEIVPYIRLREWFAVPGETPEIEQIIITGDGTQRTGIVVDEVIGQQQTVIKTLGSVFKGLEDISGATIKGDGSMALILDIPHLIRKVRRESVNV